jgi:nitrogen fixation protein NifU and related proteins
MRYSETLLDHFLRPRNAGLMQEPDGVGEEEYAGCGDLARFFLRVREGRVAQVRFQTYGCGPTIAAASAASELATARPLEAVLSLAPEDVERALDGLPDARRHAAEVVAGALRAAARDALARQAFVHEGPDV